MNGNVFWLLQVNINDGSGDAFRSLLHEMIANVRDNEPGTVNYEMFMSADGNTCHIYERFADSDAAMVHLAGFGEKFGERFMSMVVPVGITLYGDASAELRQGLAGFGALEMAPFGGITR